MAYFDVNPINTTGVSIAAASAGNKGRFIAIGFSNRSTTTEIVRIYDGTAAAGTLRVEHSLTAGASIYLVIDTPGHSVYPKSWWTSGSAIECNLDTAGDVRVFGEFVREA